jgi:hypothetical protein
MPDSSVTGARIESVRPVCRHLQGTRLERNQDLCSLFCEANELGLRRPLGPDDYDVRALGALEQLCSLSLLQHHSAHCEAVRLFAQMQELCARVLEALQSGFTIDADSCDASIY